MKTTDFRFFKGASCTISNFQFQATHQWLWEMFTIETIEMSEIIIVMYKGLEKLIAALENSSDITEEDKQALSELSELRDYMKENSINVLLISSGN
jgi:hypothetical protein